VLPTAASQILQKSHRESHWMAHQHGVFLGTERSVLADAQLQHEDLIETLNRRWAEVATNFNDWLQDTLLALSERWPTLEGGVRLDVRVFPGCCSACRLVLRLSLPCALWQCSR